MSMGDAMRARHQIIRAFVTLFLALEFVPTTCADYLETFNQQLQVQSAQMLGQAIAEDTQKKEIARRGRQSAIWAVQFADIRNGNEALVFEEPLNAFCLDGIWYKWGKLFITSQRLIVIYDGNTSDDEISRKRTVDYSISSIGEVHSKTVVDNSTRWNTFWGVKSLVCVIELGGGNTLKTKDLSVGDVKKYILEAKNKARAAAEEAARKEQERKRIVAKIEAEKKERERKLLAERKQKTVAPNVQSNSENLSDKESQGKSVGGCVAWIEAVVILILAFVIGRRIFKRKNPHGHGESTNVKDTATKNAPRYFSCLKWLSSVLGFAFSSALMGWKKFWRKDKRESCIEVGRCEFLAVVLPLFAFYIWWVSTNLVLSWWVMNGLGYGDSLYRFINAIVGWFNYKLLIGNDEFQFGYSVVSFELIFAAPIIFMFCRLVRFNHCRIKTIGKDGWQIVIFVVILILMIIEPLLKLGVILWFVDKCPISLPSVLSCLGCGLWIFYLFCEPSQQKTTT